jgi:hypothetical protein
MRAQPKSWLRTFLDLLSGFLGRKPGPASDPFAYVPAPHGRGPKGRSGRAVAEIEDDSFRSFPPRR